MSKTLLRFGPFEADIEERTLRRDGKVVALTPREFDTLRVLLENAGQKVFKDKLVKEIWGKLSVSEGNLAQQIKNLRQKLDQEGDSIIRTHPREGYSIDSVTVVLAEDPDGGAAGSQAVDSAPQRPSARRRWLVVALAAMVLVLLAVPLYLKVLSKAAPVNALIVRAVPLTKDGAPKRGPVLTGGGKIWFQELIDGKWRVVSIPESGGDAVPLSVPFEDVDLYDITADGGVLLFGSRDRGCKCTWAWPISARSAQLVREQLGEGSWASDGRTLALADNTKLLIFKGSVLNRSLTISPAARVGNPRWTPDGRYLTFDQTELKTGLTSLWRWDGVGRNAEPIHPAVGSGQDQIHGRWTRDGSYFLYEAGPRDRYDLWAVRSSMFVPSRTLEALRVTDGPLHWTWPTPGATRRDIFALGGMVSAELVRFDRKTSSWLPYLGGIPAYELDFLAMGSGSHTPDTRSTQSGKQWLTARSRFD
jgi:DNA-binding winged helix-turn-helix (wHTH) protein